MKFILKTGVVNDFQQVYLNYVVRFVFPVSDAFVFISFHYLFEWASDSNWGIDFNCGILFHHPIIL